MNTGIFEEDPYLNISKGVEIFKHLDIRIFFKKYSNTRVNCTPWRATFEWSLKIVLKIVFQKVSEVPSAEKNLRDMGYDYDSEGVLRQLDTETDTLTDKKFEFEFKKNDKAFNQVLFRTSSRKLD